MASSDSTGKVDTWRGASGTRTGRDSMSERGHLVVRAPNWVGDLVMSTPVLEAAIDEPRWNRVSIVCRPHLLPVLSGGRLDAHLRPIGVKGERHHLASLRADAILLLSNSFGSAWRARSAGIPIRAGAALGGRRFLLTHAVVPPTHGGRRVPVPTVHLHRDAAGLVGVFPRGTRPVLSVGEAHELRFHKLLETHGVEPGAGYVVCVPGASFGSSKLWPPARFAAVLNHLFDAHGWRAIVVGGPGEKAQIEAVTSAVEHDAIGWPPMEVEGLAVLKAAVRGAQFVLTGDTGPRWYAAAFEVPSVTVMGPNFPELTPAPPEGVVCRRDDLECMPCAAKVCPLGHHECMTGLGLETVIEATDALLERVGRARRSEGVA